MHLTGFKRISYNFYELSSICNSIITVLRKYDSCKKFSAPAERLIINRVGIQLRFMNENLLLKHLKLTV